MWKYLKKAFVNQWNLLAVFGASGLAVLSGDPGFWLPIVVAGETLYVGLLGTHPKFQSYVDAQEHKASQTVATVDATAGLNRILNALPERLLQRFLSLRANCLELRQIATALKASQPGTSTTDDNQTSGFDRLLWIYLRLLYTQHSLEQFLERTSKERIERDIRDLEAQLKKFGDAPLDDQRQKAKATIEDNLQTCRDRLANYEKARGNHELVLLEIDRLENKIRSLSELAVNRQDAGFITGQVDQVASNMVATERTMNDLNFATGLQATDEAVPPLMQAKVIRQTE